MTTSYSFQIAWHDRWTRPEPEALFAALKDHHRAALDALLTEVHALEAVSSSLQWFGPSWRWAFEYQDDQVPPTEDNPALFYVVPNVEIPLVSIPMTSEMISVLPMKKLNRSIREGLESAKCAVATHWAGWTPTSQSEANHLVDLIKRKREMMRGES